MQGLPMGIYDRYKAVCGAAVEDPRQRVQRGGCIGNIDIWCVSLPMFPHSIRRQRKIAMQSRNAFRYVITCLETSTAYRMPVKRS